MPQNGLIRCYLHSRLDAQWRELLNIYFARDSRIEWVSQPEDAELIVITMVGLNGNRIDFFTGRKFLVLSFGDLATAMFGLRPEDAEFRRVTKEHGAQFFYLQGEVEPRSAAKETGAAEFTDYSFDTVCTDSHIRVLTLPLGYCSGSKINLFYADNDTSAYHVNNFNRNPKYYDFDWCWIGAESSRDRTEMFGHLQGMNGRHKLVVNPVCKVHGKEARAKALHADNKPVPYAKYLDFHRRSKVCISANGLGMWNYKDAEFLANNCFVLRQFHKNLEMNPFSPKEGKHWAVFQTDQVAEAIDYYVHENEEREHINDAGHEYFRWAINGGWAGKYVDMFEEYLHKGSTAGFRKVAYYA